MEDESEDDTTKRAPKSKNYTIDDIMSLDKSLKISKKKNKGDAVMQETSKAIKKAPKKKHAKKSQKIVKFWSRMPYIY